MLVSAVRSLSVPEIEHELTSNSFYDLLVLISIQSVPVSVTNIFCLSVFLHIAPPTPATAR